MRWALALAERSSLENVMKKILLGLTISLLLATASHAALIITEVNPGGSAAATGYAADWFELTNTGPTAITLTGWSMDDSSNTPGVAPLSGVTSIAAGQSVVFLEIVGPATPASVSTAFINAWFGGSAPAGLTLGFYTGSGVGLSTGGDSVNVFDATNALVTAVTFGATTAGRTFDNAAGLSGPISTVSVAGVNGAFLSASGVETGSPGSVPEPGLALLLAPGSRRAGLARRSPRTRLIARSRADAWRGRPRGRPRRSFGSFRGARRGRAPA